MRAAIATVLAAAAVAQDPAILPVPSAGSVTCAFYLGGQHGDALVSCDFPGCSPTARWEFDVGECWLSGYCSLPDSRWGQSVGPVWTPVCPSLGSTFYWQTINMQAGTTVPHTLGSAAAFFVLAANVGDDVPSGVVAGCHPDWCNAFGSGHFIVAPTHVHTQTIGTAQVDSWILEMPIPGDPSLFGVYLQAQGCRFEPADGLFYLSSSHIVQIGI